MTIAIGVRFGEGVAICADTKVLASDGATTSAGKIHSCITRNGIYAIADASDDAHAAKMLGQDIINALSKESEVSPYNIDDPIKATMKAWHDGYGSSGVPSVNFVLATVVRGNCSLRFCKPPNTVIQERAIAIGQGARVVDALVPEVVPSHLRFGVKPTLLQVAYLTYRAKKEEGGACGGETDAVIITRSPIQVAFIDRREMTKAELLAKDVDSALTDIRLRLFTEETDKPDGAAKKYGALAQRISDFDFPSSRNLEGLIDATE